MLILVNRNGMFSIDIDVHFLIDSFNIFIGFCFLIFLQTFIEIF